MIRLISRQAAYGFFHRRTGNDPFPQSKARTNILEHHRGHAISRGASGPVLFEPRVREPSGRSEIADGHELFQLPESAVADDQDDVRRRFPFRSVDTCVLGAVTYHGPRLERADEEGVSEFTLGHLGFCHITLYKQAEK